MDKIYEQTMLFDFYGELLTEHQRSVYQDAIYNDLSLGEIAEERGISRQGVHDLLRRCDRILQEYESKLHLVERFARAKKTVQEIESLTFDGEEPDTGKSGNESEKEEKEAPEFHSSVEQNAVALQERLQDIRKLARDLLKEL